MMVVVIMMVVIREAVKNYLADFGGNDDGGNYDGGDYDGGGVVLQ